MNSRERLQATLEHRQPDRLCVDFGAGGQTGMGAGAVSNLRRTIFGDDGQIHELTNWKVFIHTCGAIYDLIPDLIEAGFDVLNPVQTSADGMDAKQLKKEFGKDIVFRGGGVDTQKILPFGTPDDVYSEVTEKIETFNDGGGFVFNSIHNVQSNVPVENMLAMFKALKDSGVEEIDLKNAAN